MYTVQLIVPFLAHFVEPFLPPFSKIQGFQNVNHKIADLKKKNVWKTLVTDLVVRLNYFFKIDREICIIGSQK